MRLPLAGGARAVSSRFAIGHVASLTQVPADDLVRLTSGRGVFGSAPYLLFMERMRAEQGVRYVTCTDTATARVVGICPVYEGGASPGSYWGPGQHYLRRAAGFSDDAAWTPGIFVGARSGYGWSFLVDGGLGQEGTGVLAAMLDAALESCDDEPAMAAMFLGDLGRDQLCRVGAEDGDFLLAGATSVLDLRPWSCFEDYLKSLARPDNARREIRAFDRSGAVTRVLDLTDGMGVAAPLFTQLEDKYGGSSTPQAELVEMQRLWESMNEAARVIVAVRDGRTIGAALFLEWEGCIYVRQAGFDYARTGGAFEYFNLVYYGVVRHALRIGAHRVDYGMATYRAKLARGAVVEPLWGLAVDRQQRVLARRPEIRAWDRHRRRAVSVGTAAALERVELP